MNDTAEHPRASRSTVAALIPAYREEKHVYGVARRAREQVDYVLVVDDGSPDGTALEARKAGVEVISHDGNRGKGAAIKTGLQALMERRCLYFMILDGDGQHRPEEIASFMDAANRTGAHLLVGTRMNDTLTMPFVRRLTNRTMSWIISGLCGQAIADTQCGFRMIHRDIAPYLFGQSDAFDYETEMLLVAAERGAKIVSVPVSTVYGQEKSKIRPVRDTLRFFKLLARHRRDRSAVS